METKPPAITDHIKWLLANKDQLALFFEIEEARFIKGPINQRVRCLIDRDLVKDHGDGFGLSERGRRTFEAIEALRFVKEI